MIAKSIKIVKRRKIVPELRIFINYFSVSDALSIQNLKLKRSIDLLCLYLRGDVRQPDWKRYIVSVDGVKAKTDCDFLSTVPPKIDKIMESKRYSPGEKVMSFDVTLCAGGDCPIKQNCHRFTAVRLGRQDFFGSPPYNFATQSCEYF
jgi:hypothetical protein